MSTIRIISGRYKGKNIPFENRKFNDADITMQKVKEALFDILGELEGAIFLDLFGGSGQIAFEALSRGASQVIISENESSRFKFISSFASSLPDSMSVMLLNMPAFYAMKLISKRGIVPNYIFADPPYDKKGTGLKLYESIISNIEKYSVANKSTELIFQHFTKNVLPQFMGSFQKHKEKQYGATTLSFYRLAESKE